MKLLNSTVWELLPACGRPAADFGGHEFLGVVWGGLGWSGVVWGGVGALLWLVWSGVVWVGLGWFGNGFGWF